MIFHLCSFKAYPIKKHFLFFLIFINFLFADNFQIYQKKAIGQELWKDKYWKLLLHANGNKSEIDSENFFLSKNGKISPKDELLATIKELYNQDVLNDDAVICRFPARIKWLKEKLELKDLPKTKCKKYTQWIKEMDATTASLIFSSAHINSPASMFGHTFIRIDSSYKSRLLSHAINYAASANQDTENGFIFAIKGLLGGYYGRYSLLPYYDKLKEYRDTEQRDIWEYNLNLSKNEVARMVDHIWELSETYSNYYFFDENCSYNMLWLLEVARPSVNLRDYFIYQVSPPETIFAIEKEHLVKDKTYRASKRTTLLAYEKSLKDSHIKIVEGLSLGEIKSDEILNNNRIDKKDKQLIFDASLELSEYNYIQRKLKKENYLKIFHNLSKSRALLGKGEKLKLKTPDNPDQGHRQLKISVGSNVNTQNGNNYYTLGLRPTYHDITNNDVGFLKGTQIEFFDSQIKVEDTNFKIDYFKLLTISSIAPQTKFFNPLSWMTSWQFDREGKDDKLDFNGRVSVGSAWKFMEDNYTYTMADLFIYDKGDTHSSLGFTAGAVLYEGKKYKTNIELTYKYFDNKESQSLVHLTQSYFPKQNIDLKFKYKYIEKFYTDQSVIGLEFNYFF
ncbi:Lnb N-terminal periplasmic domain-containing protein [Halarcobacter anaerophilus]|uniref:Uncharacterized protein n=1 Tax=Halarcobacter anaerophilus TaxID=877500 RepID=A0A4Q0Y6I0_9BACT|nr:DUF4105 domain-containing protein [Halarcobacter anaerophilus]RXJ64061.1 hypothetical protein CRV06_03735 [Halarcobacter anaerophilus]